jgi:hypothetical protein
MAGLIQAQAPVPAEAVLREALNAIAAKDQTAIKKLSIDQAEFKKYIWPGIAAQVSGSNMNAEKYYGVYAKSSEVGVKDAGDLLGQHKWEVVKVVAEPTRKGKDYQLYGAPIVTIRDEAGQEKTLKLVGGLLERAGAFKVTTFYVSPVQRAAAK